MQVLQFMRKVQIPDWNGHIRFHDTMQALVFACCGTKTLPLCDATRDLYKKNQKNQTVTGPGGIGMQPATSLDGKPLTADQTFLVALVQSKWQAYLQQKVLKEKLNALTPEQKQEMERRKSRYETTKPEPGPDGATPPSPGAPPVKKTQVAPEPAQ